MAYFECTIGGSGDGSTLTVTCYSGFAGLTISITNGVDTFSDVCPSTSPYEVEFDGLADGTWTVSTVYGGQTYTKTVEINTSTIFNPIPNGATATPINNIQTWLHCADIWNKNYTTIAQVLADASTLQALIASNNAVDYMARSTTWASSVTANANAMTYIGNNNYCANKLLANSTWSNAICNSLYFESVLKTKVPTMTSDTTPSGVVSAKDAYSGYPAWYAFGGFHDTSHGWVANSAPSWIQYQFTTPVCVKKIYVYNPAGSNRPWTGTLQGSNDGTTFTDIQSNIDGSQGVDGYTNITNNTKYKYYRMVASGTAAFIGALQFYGRA